MILWMIGVLFTWGFIADDKPGFWVNVIVIIFWPVLLGMALREWTENHKSPNKQINSDS